MDPLSMNVKKILLLAAGALLVYYVMTSPAAAAESARTGLHAIGQGLKAMADAFSSFLSKILA